MPDKMNERDILQALRPLRALQPATDHTRAAIDAARRTLTRRRIMRWTMATGAAAAAVALVVGLAFLSLAGGSAKAADALADAARSSKAYKGWVHTTMGDKAQRHWGVTHLNNETGAWVTEVHDADALEIQMYDPAAKTETRYASADRTVRIGSLYEGFAERWKAMVQQSPLTVAEEFAEVPAANVKESKKDGLLRYDITNLPGDTKASTRPRGDGAPTSLVVWADPTTKLIRHGTATIDGHEEPFTITYGEPLVRDVYDLGVPRDAKVVDARPPADVDALFKRLEARYAGGFGDHVAVVTEYQVEFDGKKIGPTGDDSASIELSSRRGKAYLANRYLLRNPDGSNSTGWHTAPRPPGWPAPQLDAALASVKEASPTSFVVSDGSGKFAWSGFASEPGKYQLSDLTTDRGEQVVPQTLAMVSFPAKVWPTRIKLGLFGADAKAGLLSEKSRPGLVGLRTVQVYPGAEMKPTRAVNTYWFDPAKDDMPVETTAVTYEGTTDKEGLRFEHHFTAYAQTKSGQWYPAEWTMTTKMAGPAAHAYTEKLHAQVWTAEKLGDEWFRWPAGVKREQRE